VTFIKSDGTRLTTQGKEGDNLLDVVVNNDLDLDGFGELLLLQCLFLSFKHVRKPLVVSILQRSEERRLYSQVQSLAILHHGLKAVPSNGTLD
jgi:hypothetical protein